MSTPKTDETIRVELPGVLVEWLDGFVQERELGSRNEAVVYAIAEFRTLIDNTKFLEEQRAAETAEENSAAFDRHLEREQRFAGLQMVIRRR